MLPSKDGPFCSLVLDRLNGVLLTEGAGWEKPEIGCIMPVDGAPLAMGGGIEGGPEGTRGGDTPTGRGGRGMGGTPARGGAIEAKEGIPKPD